MVNNDEWPNAKFECQSQAPYTPSRSSLDVSLMLPTPYGEVWELLSNVSTFIMCSFIVSSQVIVPEIVERA